jgi:hypothetical protein
MTGQLLSFPAEPFKARSSGGQLYGIGLGAADQAVEGDGYASCYGQHEPNSYQAATLPNNLFQWTAKSRTG